MEESNNKCSKCGNVLERGFIPEASQHGVGKSVWMEGEITRGLFGILKLRDRRRLPITVYRCTLCGYLELYAT